MSELPLSSKVIVATARAWDEYDPDRPSWTTDGTFMNTIQVDNFYVSIKQTLPNATYYVDTSRKWVPSYDEVNSCSAAERATYCLASAALPFGIVAPIRIKNRLYVDGGVADNVPFFALSEMELDEVFVVLLQPARSRKTEEKLMGADSQAWMERDRAIRNAEIPVPKPRLRELIPKADRKLKSFEAPSRTAPKMPQIVLFAPKQSLGGFLGGTLKFDARYAAKLMKQGYVDTLDKLAKCALSP